MPAPQDVAARSVQRDQVRLSRDLDRAEPRRVKKLTTFREIMETVGTSGDSLGCEICKPAVGSILASLHNRHVMEPEMHALQDTNDRYLVRRTFSHRS